MPSVPELKAMVDDGHLRYEVRGILMQIPPPPLDSRVAESALLHLRAVAFFLADVPKDDDVGALSYQPQGWTRPSRDALLGPGGAKELNKRLSHLTTRRLQPGFNWFVLLTRIPDVVKAFEGFVAALDASWQPRFAPILADIADWRSTRP